MTMPDTVQSNADALDGGNLTIHQRKRTGARQRDYRNLGISDPAGESDWIRLVSFSILYVALASLGYYVAIISPA
jgi:hypothetical protein